MTPTEHRARAEELLDRATDKGLDKTWSAGLLAAAQVHATLATVPYFDLSPESRLPAGRTRSSGPK